MNKHDFALYTSNIKINFKQDLLAGITMGFISVPLAMAFAIACGLQPQHGLTSRPHCF